MHILISYFKLKNYLRARYIAKIKKEPFIKYCKHYKSYNHSLKHNAESLYQNYLAAVPNRGAGIGHQMANWMAGYHYAAFFGLKFAHISFATKDYPYEPSKWENFLGFGYNETEYCQLLNSGYKLVRIPYFDENKENEVNVIRNIIKSYSDEKVVFLCEQDQFYFSLQTLIPSLQQKFYTAPSRKNDLLVYDSNNFNIAIHVRRGDIMDDPSNPNLTMRFLSNDYFYKVLCETLRIVQTDKPVHIYFFSQGVPQDYPEFNEFQNLHWCMDMNATDSFLHMVYADLLITSKSSFSYKPALINRGVKVSPHNFWHGYPKSAQWLLVDNNGNFIKDKINE